MPILGFGVGQCRELFADGRARLLKIHKLIIAHIEHIELLSRVIDEFN